MCLKSFSKVPFKGMVAVTNRMNFQKSSKGVRGEGSFSIQKLWNFWNFGDFGNFKQGFLSMRLSQKSNFRVQGMFFSTMVLILNEVEFVNAVTAGANVKFSPAL